jgi:tRNA (mo5U34)-methyltransferase
MSSEKRSPEDWHYHTMKDREGKVIWSGQYDLYELWHHFGIPDDLKGQSVIDIGTASGFFAFECEKRGAAPVVATELPGIEDWDSRKGVVHDGVNIPVANNNDFRYLHERFASSAQLHRANISDPVDPSLGRFDWVIFGSLMTHIRDLMRALENVRELTRGRAVIISSYLPGDQNKSLHWIQTPRPFDWWVPTKPLIPDMLRSVGFSRVEETGDFKLVHRDGSQHDQAAWHAFP